MRKFSSLTFLLICVLTTSVSAAPAWYSGQVARLALVGNPEGSFLVTFKNSALDNCSYGYAYFRTDQLSEVQIKNAYVLALTSLTAGLEMGIVIDKSINGPGGQCEAVGMMAADLKAK